MYNKNEQATCNIDWFCYINDYPIHVASNGSLLPKKFSTVKRFEAAWEYVNSINEVYEPEFSLDFITSSKAYDYIEYFFLQNHVRHFLPEWLKKLNLSLEQMLYARHFLIAARKGFYSFGWDEKNNYFRLIAWPGKPPVIERRKDINAYICDEHFIPSYLNGKNIVDFIESECYQTWPPNEDHLLY